MNKNEILILACQENNLYIVNDLIKNGIDLNITDNKGDTCLISTIEKIYMINENYRFIYSEFNEDCLNAENDYLEIIKILIKNGADVNITDSNGYSPLEIADGYELTKIVDFLTYGIYEQNIKNDIKLFEIAKTQYDERLNTEEIQDLIFNSLISKEKDSLIKNINKIRLKIDYNRIKEIEQNLKKEIKRQ